MEPIATIIAYQNRPTDPHAPIGSKIIHLAKTYDTMISRGDNPVEAMKTLHTQKEIYGEQLLRALMGIGTPYQNGVRKKVAIDDLQKDMLLNEDIVSQGSVLLAAGVTLNETTVMQLKNFHHAHGLNNPVEVIIPLYID